jgi:hypothetical protein
MSVPQRPKRMERRVAASMPMEMASPCVSW